MVIMVIMIDWFIQSLFDKLNFIIYSLNFDLLNLVTSVLAICVSLLVFIVLLGQFQEISRKNELDERPSIIPYETSTSNLKASNFSISILTQSKNTISYYFKNAGKRVAKNIKIKISTANEINDEFIDEKLNEYHQKLFHLPGSCKMFLTIDLDSTSIKNKNNFYINFNITYDLSDEINSKSGRLDVTIHYKRIINSIDSTSLEPVRIINNYYQ